MKPARPALNKNIIRATAMGLAALGGGGIYYHSITPTPAPTSASHRNLSLNTLRRGYENVLGTSMELVVRAVHPLAARECEVRVLAEIERLRGILSTYDAASEISRVMAGSPVESPELSTLLTAYATWSERTQGALSLNMGEVKRVWKNAAATGILPGAGQLRAAATIPRAWNVDALGKAFIIDRAVAIARHFAPEGLLNIGGDLRVWGPSTWLIGVADPKNPAENAPVLAQFALREAAVATSGGYARNFVVGTHNFSHVMDPRTLQPAAPHAAATVIAPDCVTANALSTVACLPDAELGFLLSSQWGAAEHLLTDATGKVSHTPAFILAAATEATPVVKKSAALTVDVQPEAAKPATPATPPTTAAETPAGEPWPKDFQVTINLSLKTPAAQGGRGGAKRPYVAVWVENTAGKHLRTLAVWGNNPRWQPELSKWWKDAEEASPSALASITRATRPDGEYSVVWDGHDEEGKKLPMGDYKIFVEINREHGTHGLETVTVPCQTAAKTFDLHGTGESNASKIIYGLPATPKAAPASTDKPAAPAPTDAAKPAAAAPASSAKP